MEAPGSAATEDRIPRAELDRLSTLQLLDLFGSGGLGPAASMELFGYLRERIVEVEETQEQARQALRQFDQIVGKLRAPALRIGTLLSVLEQGRARVCLGGSEYVANLDPALDVASLQVGQQVLCNEAYAVVSVLGFDLGGPISRVDELLSEGRLRVSSEGGAGSRTVLRSTLLAKEKMRPGLEVRLDANQLVALEVVGSERRIDRRLQRVDPLSWSAVGGQEEAVRAIRDAVELPYLHPELFSRFDLGIPKGFLLYGPPGCGKTLLGKATAFNLGRGGDSAVGDGMATGASDRLRFFLHVKGPEVLNMWVGESERQIRDLFAQCREHAAEGGLAFLFIDEAESILGTRHGGRWNTLASTLVPMFCTEMDGLEPLQNVIVILASNRADLIDPAILRPGRIDRKIRVTRPDRKSAEQIYRIYLDDALPLAESSAELARVVAEHQFARVDGNAFLEITYRSGRHDRLYRGDLASGAIIAAVVDRAKHLAIRRSIESSEESPLGREDLLKALAQEYAENELFPGTDLTEDWLKLTDFDPANVAKLSPVRSAREDGSRHRII